MLKLKDKLFNDFISFLTPSSITNVMKEMKQYQLDHHLRESEPKISKSGFLLIMKKLFPEYTSFNDIFNLIFNRFQSQKCILNQTNKNFIWLIVDDGSTDNTKKVVENFKTKANFKIEYYYGIMN